MRLPEGCVVRDLATHMDDRGDLTEIFRLEWGTGIEPVQWNFVRSEANVLRGVHVHVVHSDYLVCMEGSMVLALVDIRPESPTHGLSTTVVLKGERLQAALVPPGVAHGFHFPDRSSLCYSVSHYWNLVDEIGCRWDDPALGLDWRVVDPKLSPRDTNAGTAAEMTRLFLDERQRLSMAHD
ncbi:dTDP-4-dehydrorhamnose 3,5-epimerase family protein [Aminobacter sp. Piv2-1]|uniref:dTDP-4-dehydrorhamnose 3,5-epimerase family protein n=1 Tax=Aminobacter sp. Piv2-1 TaxID=3031122 RepID=UPI0030966ABD